MELDFYEIDQKIMDYYFSNKNYHIHFDPTITYQEALLIELAQMQRHYIFDWGVDNKKPIKIEVPDTLDSQKISFDFWSKFIASYTNPIEIIKPWNEVLVDKRINTPKTVKFKRDKIYPWSISSIYTPIINQMDRLRKARYKDYRIRANAKVPNYIVEGEAYDIKHKDL